jgi:hypothetical protein
MRDDYPTIDKELSENTGRLANNRKRAFRKYGMITQQPTKRAFRKQRMITEQSTKSFPKIRDDCRTIDKELFENER